MGDLNISNLLGIDWGKTTSTPPKKENPKVLQNSKENSNFDIRDLNIFSSKAHAPSYNFGGNQASFPDKTKVNQTRQVSNQTSLTPGAQTLLNAMNKYPNIKANPEERIVIARELDAASKKFGIDSKLMLAVFAHESHGIDPKAKSTTGAKGLGQLTGVAIDECIRLGGLKKEGFKDALPIFEAAKKNRYDIKANIWTSVAYMKVESDKNGSLKKTLEGYGDPNVRTYENKVAKEYQELWGSKLKL